MLEIVGKPCRHLGQAFHETKPACHVDVLGVCVIDDNINVGPADCPRRRNDMQLLAGIKECSQAPGLTAGDHRLTLLDCQRIAFALEGK